MDSIAALTDSMRNAHLSDDLGEPEYLLFKPPATTVLTPETLERIPRFLFRVASPLSDGETSETWVRSEAAVTRNGRNLLPLKDIFDNLDSEKRTVVARTLNQHLRWWPKDRDLEDNFMSWTSSLLFALQFISYRHLSSRDGSSLEEIKLYVIDTTLFPRGTFIRDLGLICAFRAFDDHPPGKDLNGLWDLRVNMGSYYFGEYLSQGSLRIENKCQVVSAQALTDEKRLSRLQPLFKEMRPKWANEVRRLRQIIWPDIDEISLRTLSEVTHDQVKAVDEIANLFGHGWRFPMAVYFAGLITQVPEPVPVPKPEHEDEEDEDGDDEPTIRPDDNLFFAYFRAIQISEKVKDSYRPSNYRVIAPENMPELRRVQEIFREIYKDSQLRAALDLVGEAEMRIRRLHTSNIFREQNDSFEANDLNPTLNRAGQKLVMKLGTVKMLCDLVERGLTSSAVTLDDTE